MLFGVRPAPHQPAPSNNVAHARADPDGTNPPCARHLMLTDARDLAPGTELETDVCIVGAGPAGLTLARELRGSGLRTLVVEGGGLEPEEDSQSLADGELSGDPFRPLIAARARRLGGTSWLWDTRWSRQDVGFRGAPLDPIDFAERDWVPDSGWPFDRAALEPYYRRAHDAAGMGRYDYSPAGWASAECPELPLEGDALESSVWLFGPQRVFAGAHRAELEAAVDVTVMLHANVVRLETTDDASAVARVHAVCLPDRRLSIRAATVILATGGMEATRLLLLSDGASPGGLGNRHDLLGRYFMEHQMIRAGILTPTSRSIFDRLGLYDERHVDGTPVMGQLHLTEAAMRRERLLNMVAAFLPIPLPRRFQRINWNAVDAFGRLAGSLRRGRLPERPLATLVEAARGGDFVAARLLQKLSGRRLFRYWGDMPPNFVDGGGWSRQDEKPRRYGTLDVIVHAEQAPNRENRITLSERRDRLGTRMAHLHWEWRPIDIDSGSRMQELLQRELARSGIGRLEISRVDGRPELFNSGLHHHMGTTRMHADPRKGVVDAECRVHGVSNLFVAASSVFPTGGYINPTLTVLALALRIADRVKLQAARPAAAIA